MKTKSTPLTVNKETHEALAATDAGEGLIYCKDVDDLFKKIGLEETPATISEPLQPPLQPK